MSKKRKKQETDVTLPIFTYGILRKQSMLEFFMREYGLSSVFIEPAVIEGYVPYHSGGVNFIFPATNKQKDKYKHDNKYKKDEPYFPVHGSLVYLYGDVKRLKELHSIIDFIESNYTKKRVVTTKGINAYVYVMDNSLKKTISFHNIGLVIYPDSILKSITLTPESLDTVDCAKCGTRTEKTYLYARLPDNTKEYLCEGCVKGEEGTEEE